MDEYGIPLTPAEFADLMSRRWDPDLFGQVRGYCLSVPEDCAGTYINQKVSGVIVEFKQQVEKHRKVLSDRVADPALVEIHQVEWSLDDLEGFMKQVEAERAWFATIGVEYIQVNRSILDNFVLVDFRGPREAASAVIKAHFGNPTWLATRWSPPPWDGPRADLVIEITDTNGRPVPNVWCEILTEHPIVKPQFGDLPFGTGPAGICELKNLPAVTYEIRLHEWVDNDHHDPDPVKVFGVVLTPAGALIPVTIPAR